MDSEANPKVYRHDAFISYSRKDADFARKLEEALERYKPPKSLGVPLRYLDIFRDESDITGVEYYQSVERHMKDSRKLIVICSPMLAKALSMKNGACATSTMKFGDSPQSIQ